MKYMTRRKIVEAFKWPASNKRVSHIPGWVEAAGESGNIFKTGPKVMVHLGKGTCVEIREGDYLIRRRDGLGVLDGDVFEAEYEPYPDMVLSVRDLLNVIEQMPRQYQEDLIAELDYRCERRRA